MSTRLARRRSLPLEFKDGPSTVESLFPRVAVTSALLLIVTTALRGDHGSKTWDKAGFALSIASAAVLAVWYLRNGVMKPSRFVLILCVGAFILGIASVERVSLTGMYWEGFGWSVVIVTVPMALLLIPLVKWIEGSRRRAIAMGVVVTPLAAFDLFSLFRDAYDFAYAPNNVYILNEMLAPVAGRVPGADFVPQYTNLFGWVLLPLRNHISAAEMVNVASIVLSAMGVISVVLTVVVASRSLPLRSLWLAMIVTVPLVTVTVLHDPSTSSIGSYFQELPTRMFPAMICTVVAIRALEGLMRGTVLTGTIVALGAVDGLFAWDSQDIGIAVAIASGIVLELAARGPLRRRTTAMWLMGLAPALVSYPLVTLSAGHPLNFQYFALAVRSFGTGFGSTPMQVPGPVLLIAPVLLGSAVVGLCLLWRSSGGLSEFPQHQRFAISTLAFVGLWSVGFLPYYFNRSYASGQLQVFLMPFAVCSCALLSLCLESPRSGSARRNVALVAYFRDHVAWLLPVALPVAVGFGALLQSPNPSITLRTLLHRAVGYDFASQLVESEPQTPRSGWPGAIGSILYAPVNHEISIMQAFAKTHGGGSVGYLGSNANYLSLSNGVQSRLLFDDVVDFSLGPDAYKLGCAYVLHNPTTWLVTSPGATGLAGVTICGAYQSLNVPNELPGTVFRIETALRNASH